MFRYIPTSSLHFPLSLPKAKREATSLPPSTAGVPAGSPLIHPLLRRREEGGTLGSRGGPVDRFRFRVSGGAAWIAVAAW